MIREKSDVGADLTNRFGFGGSVLVKTGSLTGSDSVLGADPVLLFISTRRYEA